jgi:hypothetical protein
MVAPNGSARREPNPTYCAETFSGRRVFALGDRPKVVFDFAIGNGLIVEINLIAKTDSFDLDY